MIGAYFDCGFGASGDMLLGSLLGAGASLDYVKEELSKLNFPGTGANGEKLFNQSYELVLEDVNRSTILAKKATVQLGNNSANSDTAHLSDHGKTYIEIKDFIDESDLLDIDKKLALDIFERLARSEAKVHGKDLSKVHFHEVGCLDAVIDIVGFAIAYNSLKIEKAYVSALPLGSGVVETEHGLFPVPAPAVAYLLQEAGGPVVSRKIPYECLTPTGAAILCSIACVWNQHPEFRRIDSIGYGAGSFDPEGHPNVARVMVGELNLQSGSVDRNHNGRSCAARSQIVALIEANIDDLAPDILSFTQDKLVKEGALDVSVTATTMKKGRSGHLLSVIANPKDKDHFEQLLFEETSTLGVRTYYVERQVLERDFVKVNLGDSTVCVKVAFDSSGKVVNISPEYNDCAEYARRNKIPLKDVYDLAIAGCKDELEESCR